MSDSIDDRDFTLRLAELAIRELRWQGIATKSNLERITPLVDSLVLWRRDVEQAERIRERGLSRREKLIGFLAVTGSPFAAILVQHFIR